MVWNLFMVESAMMLRVMRFIVVGLVCLALGGARASQVVMKAYSTGFVKALNDCKKEMDLSEQVFEDFKNFWKDDFVAKDPKTGCAIICLAAKLDLLDPDGELHHGNAHAFAKKHGADDAMATQLVEMFHSCHQTAPDDDNPCVKVMSAAMCFKKKIHDLNWNPDSELIMAEILAEV